VTLSRILIAAAVWAGVSILVGRRLARMSTEVEP
jgi:hypothetical protein